MAVEMFSCGAIRNPCSTSPYHPGMQNATMGGYGGYSGMQPMMSGGPPMMSGMSGSGHYHPGYSSSGYSLAGVFGGYDGMPHETSATMKNQTHVGFCTTALAHCCCLEVKNTAQVAEWMILHNNHGMNNKTHEPPSCFQICCMCQWWAQERRPSDIDQVRQLRGLTGVLLETDTRELGVAHGRLMTLKWGEGHLQYQVKRTRDGRIWTDYDPDLRTLTYSVYGGFGRARAVGLHTAPTGCSSCCWLNCARCVNYSHRLRFSPDFTMAIVDIFWNPCCCIPCLPPWCTPSKDCIALDMVQEGNTVGLLNGTRWERRQSKCGGPFRRYAELMTVYHSDGSKGPFFDHFLEKVPQQVMVTY
eukprot:TRINITY_DN7015_c2_g1_i1.p1 TRINITY_DN7015_c2_g1~~TRINITY_DN7015_c2_g1_i1.p1  ORF type:complete len:387 (+),score=53.34 TRINITY_DN7015_c2_g1_i1:88-1161(+)